MMLSKQSSLVHLHSLRYKLTFIKLDNQAKRLLTTYNHNSDQIKEQTLDKRLENLKLWTAIDTIKRSGFKIVQLDALGLQKPPSSFASVSLLGHKLISELLENKNTQLVDPSVFVETSKDDKEPFIKVTDLLKIVDDIYVNRGCGLEFGHMSSEKEIDFLTSQWEILSQQQRPDQGTLDNYAKLLLESEVFDQFLATKFPTTKRYGLEGAESLVLLVQELLRLASCGTCAHPISDVIIGAPHRGRLNLMCCLLNFQPVAVFAKIRGIPELNLTKAWMSTGDVLSHLSLNTRYVYGADKHSIGLSQSSPDPINVTLLPNPSHLEVVSPMLVGVARGRASNNSRKYSSNSKLLSNKNSLSSLGDKNYDYLCRHVLPIQMHGDAAFAGQGIIQETLQMSLAKNYSINGSIHIVVNNQIGYTTEPQQGGRSSEYCSDIMKMINAPVIHVNGDNIVAVVKAAQLAFAYRAKFHKDIAVDLVCYRKHGHNEMDDPSITQPIMYQVIKNKRTLPEQFASDTCNMDEKARTSIRESYKCMLQSQYKLIDNFRPDNDNYRNFNLPSEYHRDHLCKWTTGCELETLQQIALASVQVPSDFSLHPTVKRTLVDDRVSKFGIQSTNIANIKVDWALAEILAFGSLILKDQKGVRISGQDVARGTFSTRHAIFYDNKQQNRQHTPLNHLKPNQKHKLEVANSILSEEAVLAFEYGFSIETNELLCVWEAQFGDFYNTAQSIIDTLVSCGEKKWLKQSSLTLLLPHGLDGMGPEHSSGRIERFLQSSLSYQNSIDTQATVNWCVTFPTLPSQYFHLLRRQLVRPFNKPLIVMAPKMIFRHPKCTSLLGEFDTNYTFKPVLDDPNIVLSNSRVVDTLVFCCGKVYFALEEQKILKDMQNVALIRLEELCPFPVKDIADILRKYKHLVPNLKTYWLQEEHKNQGAYEFVDRRFKNLLSTDLEYIGRCESEMPATGSGFLHKKELEHIMEQFSCL